MLKLKNYSLVEFTLRRRTRLVPYWSIQWATSSIYLLHCSISLCSQSWHQRFMSLWSTLTTYDGLEFDLLTIPHYKKKNPLRPHRARSPHFTQTKSLRPVFTRQFTIYVLQFLMLDNSSVSLRLYFIAYKLVLYFPFYPEYTFRYIIAVQRPCSPSWALRCVYLRPIKHNNNISKYKLPVFPSMKTIKIYNMSTTGTPFH